RALMFAEFLAQHTVVGPFARKKVADGALGAAIGFGHGIEIAFALLVRHINALTEQGPDDLARTVGQAMSQSDQFRCDKIGRDGHGLKPHPHHRSVQEPRLPRFASRACADAATAHACAGECFWASPPPTRHPRYRPSPAPKSSAR